MIKHRTPPLLTALLVLLITKSAYADKDHHDDHHDEQEHAEQHGSVTEAHVHGSAELLIVLDGQDLQIELHSPAVNLLGFEHAAKNAEQKAKIEELSQTLAKADHLFEVSRSATCTLSKHDVDLGHLTIENAVKDEEGHSNNEHTEEGKPHSDIEAKYHYICEQPDVIGSVTTTINDEFPTIESLQVQWVANGKQGAATLEQNQHEIIFK